MSGPEQPRGGSRYEFIVSRGDDLLLHDFKKLSGLREVWDEIAEIAGEIDLPGARISVRDEKGDLAIMLGVLAAKAVLQS